MYFVLSYIWCGVRSDAQSVAQRPDFKSALRVVKMVLNIQCYQYLWLTMWFHQPILNTVSSRPSLVGGASACAVPPLKYLWQAFLALLCSFKWTGWLLNSLWPWRLKLSQLASSWVWEFIKRKRQTLDEECKRLDGRPYPSLFTTDQSEPSL